MARSYVQYRGEGSFFRDADLLLLQHLVIRSWRSHDGEGKLSSLRPLIESWSNNEDIYCSGCIDLELDALLSSPEAARSLITLIDWADHDVQSLGDRISGASLTEMADAPALFSYPDWDTSRVLGLLQSFRALLLRALQS
ncbi:hypothetical protein [Nannocystis pusilla]|uniref:hypothetical protein n=1 Tax=Nannocystis pusilla TaxID=889268 RepID=UPI003DA2AF1A